MEVHGIAQCIWPQSNVDCLRPASARVEQLLACALREITDGLLGYVVLEVRIYATKGELLSCIMTCLLEGIVVESPIVAVVVKDVHSVFGRVLHKSKLGAERLC